MYNGFMLLLRKKIKSLSKTEQLNKSIKQNKRLFIKLAIAIGTCVAFLMFLLILRASSVAASEFITRTISNVLVSSIGILTSIIPVISLAEILIFGGVLLLVFGITLSILNLKDRKFTLVLKRFMILVIIAISCGSYFIITTGFSYNRADISNGITLSDSVPRGEEINSIANFFMDDFIYVSERMERDKNGLTIVNYSFFRLGEMLRNEFRRLDGNPYFFMHTPRPKMFINTWWFSTVGVAGMAFVPTGEGLTNSMPPTVGNIITMAHELAHTRGVMRENDADLVAFYILVTSSNPLFRYVGYMYSIRHLGTAVFLGNNLDTELSNAFFTRWPREAETDRNSVWLWWRNYRNANPINRAMREVGNFFNHIYLILSGIREGTGNYGNFPDGHETTEERDPETDRPIVIPRYNHVQRMFFAIYEAIHN